MSGASETAPTIAQRFVACKRWEWTEAMLARIRFRDHPCGAIEFGTMAYRLDRPARDINAVLQLKYGWMRIDDFAAVPDLDDDATRGCILGLIQRAHNDPWLHPVPCYRKRSPIGWELGWAVSRKDNSNGGLFLWGATAGEALLNALEAAPCSHP